MTTDIPHLRQIPEAVVSAYCNRADDLVRHSYTMRLEVQGFRESRTAWDATRLANALVMLMPHKPEAMALVRELDASAECASGLHELPNKIKRPAA